MSAPPGTTRASAARRASWLRLEIRGHDRQAGVKLARARALGAPTLGDDALLALVR